MDLEVVVTLLKGHRIIDAQALHRGDVFRVAPSDPQALDSAEAAAPDDVIVDFRSPEPILYVPAGIRGELALGERAAELTEGVQVFDHDTRGWLALDGATLLVQGRVPLPSAPHAANPIGWRLWWPRIERPLLLSLGVALVLEVSALIFVHRQPPVPLFPDPPIDQAAGFVPVRLPPVKVPAVPQPRPKAARTTRASPAGPRAAPVPTRNAHAGPGAVQYLVNLFTRSPVFSPGPVPNLSKEFEQVRVANVVNQDIPTHRSSGGATDPLQLGSWAPHADSPRPGLPDRPGPVPALTFPEVPDDPEPPGPKRDSDDLTRIHLAVRSHSRQIQACYEKGLRGAPGLHGRMSVQLNVLRSGRVDDVSFLGGDLTDPVVTECIGLTIRHWQLPELKSHDELDVELTYVFSPGG